MEAFKICTNKVMADDSVPEKQSQVLIYKDTP